MTRKTRAIVFPTIGDPYRAGIWLSSYRKHIQNEVDQLYVYINSSADMAVLDYDRELYENAGAKILFSDHHLHQNQLIGELLESVEEDLVLLTEDDFYIVDPGHVNRWFNMIEEGHVDAVGSPRGCCSVEMTNRTKEVFSLKGQEALSTNFWPCLYAGWTKDLLRIRERVYGPHTHPSGTHIPELNWTTSKDEPGDVFVWASIQLRALGLKFHIEDQGNWIDIITRQQSMPWIHTGAGSSSFLNHLITPDGKALGNRNNIPATFNLLPDDGILYVRETIQAFWELALQHFPIPKEHPAAYFNNVYASALQYARDEIKTVNGIKMRNEMIDKQKAFYRSTLASILC